MRPRRPSKSQVCGEVTVSSHRDATSDYSSGRAPSQRRNSISSHRTVPSDFVIERVFAENDCLDATRLTLLEIAAMTFCGYDVPTSRGFEYLHKYWKSVFEQPNENIVWTLYVRGVLAGVVRARPNDDPSNTIWEMPIFALMPNFQKKGYAAQLLKYVETELINTCQARRIDIFIDTVFCNAAHRFFTRQLYEESEDFETMPTYLTLDGVTSATVSVLRMCKKFD